MPICVLRTYILDNYGAQPPMLLNLKKLGDFQDICVYFVYAMLVFCQDQKTDKK